MTVAEVETVPDPRTRQKVRQVKAVYATYKEDLTEFGFLRADLDAFINHMEFIGYDTNQMNITYRDMYEPVTMPNVMKEEFKPRDKQKPAVEFLSKKEAKNRVIDAATGFGKSFLGLNTALNCEERAAFIMEPGHIKTWLKSIPEQTHINPKDVVVIQGSANLKALLDLERAGQNHYKLIFFSAVTLRNYYKEYEGLEFDYDVKPHDLFEYLKVGTIIRDEVHESIHSLVRQVIYTHVPRVIFLSATLVSDNSFINKVYERVFPKADRWKSDDNRHICVRSVLYDMYDPKRKIKSKGFRGYSHVKYEQSIMKNKKVLEQYLDFLASMANASFVKTYKDGCKFLMICSTKEMCKLVAERMKADYPQFTVGVYIHGAKDEELYERDMVISTPKGAGTGVDIPNLSTGWLTVALSSTQLGRQIMGRLRPIKKYPDRDPMFLYLTNKSISAHRQYDTKRRQDVRFRSKDFKAIDTGFILKAA
ncbi:DNA helicase [Vibrio phage vB_VpaM_sm033]|nr:DNA helicase [Vibrio phage vB_VpaM_sm033]